MKRLKKILLINWHMFSCTEIDVTDNMLVTGHNGAGKSTLLDAVQYVLTGGRTKFNLAANEDGTRRLEGYIRGRLGMEGKENLRDGDVCTHVVLEFEDDLGKKPFILGALAELPEGGKPQERFYSVSGTGIVKEDYISGHNEVFRKASLEKNLKHRGLKPVFADNKKMARSMVCRALNLNSKYCELLPRALAFRPIGNLNEFIFQFLLPEENVNVSRLKDNVRQYRELEQQLEEQQGILKVLEQINECDRKQKEIQRTVLVTDLLSGMISVEENTALIRQNREMIAGKKKDRDFNRDAKERFDRRQTELLDQLAEINVQLKNLDPEGLIQKLEMRESALKTFFEDDKKWLQKTAASAKKDLPVLKQLNVVHGLSDDPETILNDADIERKASDCEVRIQSMRMTNAERGFRISQEKKQNNDDLQKTEKELSLLEQKKYPYRKEVTALISLLENELSRSVGRSVTVRPFCEYLEITDETWRNAVEGFLNTQRFDLFVEPQYFRKAAGIYERFKSEHGIYGVGIVDTGKLDGYREYAEGSLADKVSSDYEYARLYANMLLGNVMCVDDAEQLNRYPRSITTSCMVYRNHTVRAINPNVYQKPYIGNRAIEIQFDIMKRKKAELKETLSSIRERENDVRRERERLELLHLDYWHGASSAQQKYLSDQSELNDVSGQLKNLKKNPSWITLTEQQTAVSERLDETRAAYRSVTDTVIELEQQIEVLKKESEELQTALKEADHKRVSTESENLELVHEAEREYGILKKEARGEFSRMRYRLSGRIEKADQQLRIQKNELLDYMHRYNQQTAFGFEESSDALPQYMEQYFRLRDLGIENLREKARIARGKCEDSFREDFISKLRSLLEGARKNIRELNRSLTDKDFQGDRYEFVIEASRDPVFRMYYQILNSNQDYPTDNLFMEELSETNRQAMDDLFARLVSFDSSQSDEKLLRDYTDYRKYLSYDIRIHHRDGSVTMYSKVNREKSGGETQTPFYVIIAASFDQLTSTIRKDEETGCLVLFDEAFNNMDESRIEALMRFYNDLNIQVMIAVPEGRVRSIVSYVDTTLLLVKKNDTIVHKVITRDEN